MSNYITYVIKNTNNDEFMVCRREGKVDSLRATNIYKTYEESYNVAKAYNFGREPMDETRHHEVQQRKIRKYLSFFYSIYFSTLNR